MKVAAPKAIVPGERRVAIVPETVTRLKKLGLEVLIQAGAGESAGFLDAAYEAAGAKIVSEPVVMYSEADLVALPNAPTAEQLSAMLYNRVTSGSSTKPGNSPLYFKV